MNDSQEGKKDLFDFKNVPRAGFLHLNVTQKNAKEREKLLR